MDTAQRTTVTQPDDQAAPATIEAVPAEPVATEDALVEDVLVEEVSIDGMCGVY